MMRTSTPRSIAAVECLLLLFCFTSRPDPEHFLNSCSGIYDGRLGVEYFDGCNITLSEPLAATLAAAAIYNGLPQEAAMVCAPRSRFRSRSAKTAIKACYQVRHDPMYGATPAACTARGDAADVLVLGSSVARGHRESPGAGITPSCGGGVAERSQMCGWAGLLAGALSERGLCVATEAISGSSAASTGWVLQAALRRHCASCVVVFGLAPANEGLPYANNVTAEAVGRRFLRDLRRIADEAAASPRVRAVVLAGVYPHGRYQPFHARVLHWVDEEMRRWPHYVVDFLSAVDDGHGRWREGLSQATDGGSHPNAEGYRRMFEAFDVPRLAALAAPAAST